MRAAHFAACVSYVLLLGAAEGRAQVSAEPDQTRAAGSTAETPPGHFPSGEMAAELARLGQPAVERAIGYLRTQQAPDGGFSSVADPGATALIATGLMQHGLTDRDPMVARALQYLRGFIQPDGGVYRPETYYRNYETCLAIQCFAQANAGGEYTDRIERATAFVRGEQWDETEGIDVNDPAYGGAGYGRHGRPDLSNTQYLLDALHASGDGNNYEAIQRALIFVSRCQNLPSEHNTTKFPERNPDGGFYYTPAAGGSSQAGNTPNGGLRSYGSMTYAGLKSMIYAGLNPNDKRVAAAAQWIRAHYSLEENPGMGASGLYYYYHTFAKALDALGEESFQDASGTVHHWRLELLQTLVERQQPDGSWQNSQDRWYEADPNLVTGYVLMTLAYCR